MKLTAIATKVAFATALAPLLLLVLLVSLRVCLTLWYGGDRSEFDRQYEERVADELANLTSAEERIAALAALWRPQPGWQRQLLASGEGPSDPCRAESYPAPGGKRSLGIACATIEVYSVPGGGRPEHLHLGDYARGRAVGLIARAIRMSGERSRDLAVVGVYQEQELGEDDKVVFFATAEPPHGEGDLVLHIEQTLEVLQDTATGRRPPAGFRSEKIASGPPG